MSKLSALKAAPKEASSKFISHLIIGGDLFALDLYIHIHEKHGAEKVSLLSEKPLDFEHILSSSHAMEIRGRVDIDLAKELVPSLASEEEIGPSLYYKDTSLKEFGGRGKPEALLFNEEYFSQPKLNYCHEMIFPWIREWKENNSNVLALSHLKENQLNLLIKDIQKTVPDDLIEQKNWLITLTDGSELTCEHLYWAKSPKEFLHLYKDKNELEKDFIEYCESAGNTYTFNLTLKLDQPVTDLKQTLLLPQSYTHDHGHFICEFLPGENSSQNLEIQFFLEPNQSSEEEISRKIRQIKKNLTKIFEKFSETNFSEYLFLNEQSSSTEIKDEKFFNVKDTLPCLSMVGTNAPLEHSEISKICQGFNQTDSACIKFFTRSLLNQTRLKQNI